MAQPPALLETDSIIQTQSPCLVLRLDSSCVQEENPKTIAEYMELYLPATTGEESLTGSSLKAVRHHKEHLQRNLLPMKEGDLLPETLQQQVWFTPLMLILFFVYANVCGGYAKMMLRDLKTFFLGNTSNSYRKGNATEVSQMRTIVYSVSVIPIAVFCNFAKLSISGHLSAPYFVAFSIALVGITLYVLFKLMTMRVLTYVFFDRDTYDTAKSGLMLVLFGLSIILLVVDLFVAYSPIKETMMMVGYVACGLAVLVYLLKLLTLFFSGIGSVFYIILYLCTLEIMPTAALVAMLLNFV